MNDTPLISVLIPTYNCAKYISQAIESVLAQDYDNLEIIVADDGSTDDTADIVQRIVETRLIASLPNTIHYFHKPHSGISATRNFALAKARGELIAWCDADDYWLDGKLNAQLEYLAQNADCQIVYTRFRNVLENDELKNNERVQYELDAEKINKMLLTTSLLYRKVFDITGAFSEALAVNEDAEMNHRFRISGFSTAHCIETDFYCRRLHGNNMTLLQNSGIFQFTRDFFLKSLIKNVQRNYQ
ncbi:MAG: glycosyltransferase family 2 protein [Paludibacter sp.]|jgi:glycosyltransferase involved in cell wall biosynthesis|nr:glycosyltransferase family 2 protein [Paludibacter sp.]